MDKKKTYGLLAIAFLFIGAFSPVIVKPIVGGQTILTATSGNSFLIWSLICLVLYLMKAKDQAQIACGIILLLVVTGEAFNAHLHVEDLRSRLPFLGEALRDSIRLGWGWIPLFLVPIFFIGSALEKKAVTCPNCGNNLKFKQFKCGNCAIELKWDNNTPIISANIPSEDNQNKAQTD